MDAILSLYTCDRDHLHAEVRAGPDLLGSVIVGPVDDWPDLKEICRDERGRFAPCGAISAAGGTGNTARQRQEMSDRRMEEARKLVKAIKEGPQPAPAHAINRLVTRMDTMTVKELHQLKQEHNLKASGKTKEALVNKLTDRFAAQAGKGGGSPRPDAGVPKGTFGTPKNLTWTTPESRVAQHVKDMLGEGATKEDLAGCVGAPDGSRISMAYEGGIAGEKSWTVTFRGSKDGEPYEGRRTINQKGDGTKYIHNDLFEGKGAGLQMLGRQVENASQHGFDHIETFAAGYGGGVTGQRNDASHYNGYYTWPRFGYNDKVPSGVYAHLPGPLKAQVDQHGGNVSGLMATKAGRDYWLGHGRGLHDAHFDLKQGSYSQRTLNSYLKERGILQKSLL